MMTGKGKRWVVASTAVLTLLGSACGQTGEVAPAGQDEGSGGEAGDAASDGGTDSAAGDSTTGTSGGDSDGGSTGEDVPAFQPGTDVDIDSGRIRGEKDGDLRIFRGVPFAAPPVGNFRFAPPQPVVPWTDVLDATQFRAACPQSEVPLFNEPAYGPVELSENCLHLNVWAYDDPTPRPVMVFIHGGAFVTGAGSASLYEASDLARRGDVVVVTINYRLGALGFLATEALAAESGEDSGGNYGIMDQLSALEWVQRNISVFGGDPDNVTIFGESAGGISVCSLIGVPEADGLYHRALIESGVGCAALATERGEPTPMGQPAAIEGGEALAADLGCPAGPDQIACLRELDVAPLVDAVSLTGLMFGDTSNKTLPASPHVDGAFITEQPLQRLSSGQVDVPLMTGTNRDEATLFFGTTPIVTRLDLRREVANFLGDDALAEQVLAHYPAADYPIPRDAFLDMVTDFGFACPNLAVASAAQGGEPAYLYEFQRVYPGLLAMGSFHALELAYVFGNFDAIGIVPSTPDFELREHMQRAWTSFARTGVPELSSGWNAFDEAEPIAILDQEPATVPRSEFREGRCQPLADLGLTPQ